MIVKLSLTILSVLLMACSEQSGGNSQKDMGSAAADSSSSASATLPYGSWPSPISAASLVEGSRGIGGLRKDGDYFYWIESRPEQGGR
ncbi:MAG: hypothetical protein NWP69_06475, partial [Congregibacter sp.]|nr:hypothetical protein [Congregibacter sp.]